eukprot:4927644-Ditylum_brightwellii.AAC.1
MNPPAARSVPNHRILVYVPANALPTITNPVALLPVPLVDVLVIVRVVSLLFGTPVPALFVLVIAILVWLALGTRAKQANTQKLSIANLTSSLLSWLWSPCHWLCL